MQTEEHRRFEGILHVFVLCNLAIAQPLLHSVSRNAQFLVARHGGWADIFLLLISLCLMIPLFIVAVEAFAKCFSAGLYRRFHMLIVAVLISALLLPGIKKSFPIPGVLLLASVLLFCMGVSAGIERFKSVRMFFNFLFPALLVVPAVFLFQPFIQKVMKTEAVLAPFVRVNSTTPVVLLVFDELPVISLMDEYHQIDEVRYPNFARFAEKAIWFRDTTTVSSATEHALAAIVTGMYPKEGLLATAGDYPRNLFTLLGSRYEMKVFEPVTSFCPRSLRTGDYEIPLIHRVRLMLLDLSAVYLHMILPNDLTSRLPSVTQDWEDFWGTKKSPDNSQQQPTWDSSQAEIFRAFRQSITPYKRPALYYLHLKLPHPPWKYLPSGKEYDCYRFGHPGVEGLNKAEAWENDELAIVKGYRRHLLQVAFVDRLVGELIDRLNETGLYDRSLIIISADHGVSFHPGESRRNLSQKNYAEVMAVPFFLKLPYQSEGLVSDRGIETVDILPTIASILQIHNPWPVDGHSALDKTLPERMGRNLFFGRIVHQEYDPNAKYTALQQKLRLFGSRTINEKLFTIGEHEQLIGRAVKDLKVQNQARIRVVLDQPETFRNVDLNSQVVPVYITGRAYSNGHRGSDVLLGIAVNGILRAVTPVGPLPNGLQGFTALVPEKSFHAGSNRVEVIVLSPEYSWPK